MDVVASQGPCFICPSSDAGTWYVSGNYYCYSCHMQIIADKAARKPSKPLLAPTLDLPIGLTFNPSEFSYEALKWLYDHYVTSELIEKHKIGYDRETKRVFLPVVVDNEITAYSSRAVAPSKYKYISRGDKKKLFTTGPGTNKIVLVEDLLSCIRVGEVTDCAYLQGTFLSLPNAKKLISAYDELILWLDGDEAGIKARDKIHKLLTNIELNNLKKNLWQTNYKRTIIRTITTDKDPKCYSTREIKEILNYESIY